MIATTLTPATLADYPVIQNMARFYLYELSRTCGKGSNEWAIPSDGLYECDDFKKYFEEEDREAYVIKIANELAGFALLDKEVKSTTSEWNMGEFFVLARFQRAGVAQKVAHQIWVSHPGIWEVSVIPDNTPALHFWRKVIADYTNHNYTEEVKDVDYDNYQPKRVILTFDAKNKVTHVDRAISTRLAVARDISAIVNLSHQKRLDYEKAQPQFWKYAGPAAEELQSKWFNALLSHKDYIILTASAEDKIIGFFIGRLITTPEVYDPGGLTLIIDDFCVETEDLWDSVGAKLIEEIKLLTKKKGAAQILVVTGDHDGAKYSFLKNIGLTVASRWYVGGVE